MTHEPISEAETDSQMQKPAPGCEGAWGWGRDRLGGRGRICLQTSCRRDVSRSPSGSVSKALLNSESGLEVEVLGGYLNLGVIGTTWMVFKL